LELDLGLKASQRSTQAGAGAGFLTLFTLFWNGVVWGLLVPQHGAPTWFKAVFVIAGLLVAWGSVVSWRNRLRGGGMRLRLEHDPVPHGVPTTAYFTLAKPLALQVWTLDVELDTAKGPQSGFGRVWEGRFPATTVPSVVAGEIVVQDVKVEFSLPADLPSTQDKDFRATLVLHGDDLSWRFDVQTRPGTASELTFHHEARAWGAAPVTSPREPLDAQAERPHRPARLVWVRRSVQLLAWGIFAWFAWDFAQPFWREAPRIGRHLTELWTQGPLERLKATVGEPFGSDSEGIGTEVNTPAFPLVVTNWLQDDWRYRAHLEATAQIEQGQLHVRIDRLQLMPVSPCQGADDCQITGVGLVLSQDAGGRFNTLAQSDNLAWPVDLGGVHKAELRAGEWVLKLPASVPEGDVRLKLVVQAARKDPDTGQTGPSWVYPSHGNHLALRMALAQAAATSSGASENPCEGVDSLQAVVRAGCNERLASLLAGGAASDQVALDDALLNAVLSFNQAAVPRLLQAGANPNATDRQKPSHTALVWAAAGNQLQAMKALVDAGAEVNHRAVSRDEQIITPLTLALKRDAADAVAFLLAAGAPIDNNDLNHWTVMHIAAFEGATDSMAVLVAAGGDVNQRAGSYRLQTAFHTALQYAPLSTIEAMLAAGADIRLTDDQGENACGWARFFRRPAAIQARVCPA
jgi:ankyrin repeat protein